MNIEEEIARNVKASLDARQAPQGVSVGEIAAALMPLVRRAQAEALREAADALDREFQDIPAWMEAYREGVRTNEWMSGGARMVTSATGVLRNRADRIEQEAGA